MPTLAFLGLAPLVVFAVILRPRAAVLGAVPVLMLPFTLDVGGFAYQFVLLALLEIGIILGSWRRLREFALLVVLIAVSASMLVVSYLFNSREVVSDSVARSGLVALLLCLGAVLAVALAAPNPLRMLQLVAISGAASSTYSSLIAQVSVSGRLTSGELNANSLGHVAAISIVALVAISWLGKSPWWLLLALPSAYILFSTHSRASFIIVAVGIGVFVLSGLTRRLRVVVSIGAAVVILAAVVVQQATGIAAFTAGRSEQKAEGSTEQRGELLQIALGLILQNPIAGVGFRSFPDYSYEVFHFGFNTHNDYVRLAVEAGVPTLLCVLAIVLVPLFAAHGKGTLQRIGTPVVAATAVSFLFGNTMSLLAVSLPFWFTVGLFWSQRAPRPAVFEFIGNPDHSHARSLPTLTR